VAAIWSSGSRACVLLGEGESLPFPLTVHLQVTTRCNLRCVGCWYRKRTQRDLPWSFAERLIHEMADAGSLWLAVGGGEPLVWPDLARLVSEARGLGIRVAITTNGTVYHEDVTPDRVHVSYDAMHGVPWPTLCEHLEQYRGQGALVGVNHVVTTPQDLQKAYQALRDGVDAVTLLLHKPPRLDGVPWGEVVGLIQAQPRKIWVDACLARVLEARGLISTDFPCRQGITSMYVDAHGRAARCSNVAERIRYTGLVSTWQQLASPPDEWEPKPCIVESMKAVRKER